MQSFPYLLSLKSFIKVEVGARIGIQKNNLLYKDFKKELLIDNLLTHLYARETAP
jgi:hypothetical protein